MMAGEVLVGLRALETRMVLREGETVNFVANGRKLELAIVDPSDPEYDDVVVIPGSRFAFDDEEKYPEPEFSHPDLPFDVQIVSFYKNSAIRDVTESDENLGHRRFREASNRVQNRPRPGHEAKAGEHTGRVRAI